jgi:hypothetical protein
MKIGSGLLWSAAAALLLSGGAAHANLLSNGSFTTGDFTDWTLADSANGALAPADSGLPAVTSFNVTGGGAQDAATFETGLTSGPISV